MAITSQEELQHLLEQINSLNAADVDIMVSTAHYNANGWLDGIYAGALVAKCTPPVIHDFLAAAGARHPDYGGATFGDVIHPHSYPTGNPKNPCASRDDFYCWSPS